MKQLKIFIILTFLSVLMPLQAVNSDNPKREVRAMWLTTIGGLDWPRMKASDAESIRQQQQELLHILDQLQAAHFNTVLFQTRIRSTVIYPSAIEPWDECLTGQSDRHPGYDPLQFAIDECHKRQMELHAWVVAFPGNNFASAGRLKQKALQKRVPKLCMKTSDSWMLNPGEPGTADYLADICTEIVRNYDVDGIHLDYIRYPEQSIKYSDAATYKKYGKGQNLSSWRRDNVTHCVRTIHHAIKSLKPWVRFSCSPVGKFNDLSRYSSRGWNAYKTVCQDAQGWLKEGLMDMLIPMMYFQGNHFYPFVADWIENAYGRIVVPGLGAYMLASNQRDWPLEVIARENHVTRSLGAHGQAYFRSRFVTDNTKGIYDFLQANFYATPAFTPALSWEPTQPVNPPSNGHIVQEPRQTLLSWAPTTDTGITYNVYRSYTYPVDIENMDNLIVYKTTACSIHQPMMPECFMPYYAVTAMDRYGNESIPLTLNSPSPMAEKSAYCTNLLYLKDTLIQLPPKGKDNYLMITDQTEKTIKTMRYIQEINPASLPPGIYTVRSLGKKGSTHLLGKIIVK